MQIVKIKKCQPNQKKKNQLMSETRGKNHKIRV